ncbi:MAG: hypothetical protein ACXWWC_04470 [Chitinophagaceae bacterium]
MSAFIFYIRHQFKLALLYEASSLLTAYFDASGSNSFTYALL